MFFFIFLIKLSMQGVKTCNKIAPRLLSVLHPHKGFRDCQKSYVKYKYLQVGFKDPHGKTLCMPMLVNIFDLASILLDCRNLVQVKICNILQHFFLFHFSFFNLSLAFSLILTRSQQKCQEEEITASIIVKEGFALTRFPQTSNIP